MARNLKSGTPYLQGIRSFIIHPPIKIARKWL
jgi:hypothetical protein